MANYNAINLGEAVKSLRFLGGRSTAVALCDTLVGEKYHRRDVQLAIQRAIDKRLLTVGSDWELSLAVEAPAVVRGDAL
jgi:hypothetical protein